MQTNNLWVYEIIEALKKLGGQASLIDLYNMVEESGNTDFSKYIDWKSQIRKNIYIHSSNADIFKYTVGGEMDLFYSIDGKGKGIWGLRNFERNTPNDNTTQTVEKKRNPAWKRDELILALDLYFRHNPNHISSKHEEVVKLGKLLNSLPIHGNQANANFRNPNGVYMKMCNFLRFDPNYKGKGLERGSKLEEEVWDKFYNDKNKLHNIAQSIISSVNYEKEEVSKSISIDEEEEFPEGKVLYRLHKQRERNSNVVKKKKQIAIEENKLKCEICKFDFFKTYGDLGEGFIECHHTIPVSNYKENTKTKLNDLVLVCSNCHRMLHRKRPWLSKEQLQDLLNSN
ncbi:HNH endonuclease [Peribacillus frigoritolerans]|uniref:HNH endonuclease n=1 Tax=Peribacillus frigoritolerans TaxID=450367 RepID=UPI003D046FEA